MTPTGGAKAGKGLVPLNNNIGGRTDIVIAISVIASVLLIIISAILFVKCRMGKEDPQNKQRPNGHLCQLTDARHRKNSHFEDIYDSCARSAILSVASDQQLAGPGSLSPRLNGAEHRLATGTLGRHAPYGTLAGAGHTVSMGANLSDSDSWLESSRSRETSPSSSIPPSLPAFRVIPLCEADTPGAAHLSDPALLPPMFARNSRDFATPKPLPEVGQGEDPAQPPAAGGAQQPLLRRNQYWV